MITYLDSEIGAMRKYHDRLSGQIMDLGGGLESLERATHIIDYHKPSTSAIWIPGNLCDLDTYRVFSDKQFDWVYCNHTLEDLYDPFIVLREAQRIAKRGLFGVPNWECEIAIQVRRGDWENISGWPHHFWLIGRNKSTDRLEFFPKLCWVVGGERDYERQNINFEWDGEELPYANIHWDYTGESRRQALIRWLEERWV